MTRVPSVRRRRAVPVSLVVALALVGAACSGGDDRGAGGDRPSPARPVGGEPGAAAGPAWPVPDWAVVSPEAAGLDRAPLAALADTAGRAGSDCLVVVRGGRIVGEHYWAGRDADDRHEAWSVTKSMASTLVGIAADRGLVDIHRPVAHYVEAWRGTDKAGITVRDLLAQTGGRPTDEEFGAFPLAADQTAYALAMPAGVGPGREWAYSNSGVQVLEAVLEAATGTSALAWAERELFGPTGMRSTVRRDEAGNMLTYAGAQTSCRDLARFGLLHLRGGEWDGERVFTESWAREAASPSSDLNPAYGYLWWLNRSGTLGGTEAETREGTPMPAASADAYYAAGMFGQLVLVLPEWDAVVIRMGAATGADGTGITPADLAQAVAEAVAGGVAASSGA